jgi:hypothetical protein
MTGQQSLMQEWIDQKSVTLRVITGRGPSSPVAGRQTQTFDAIGWHAGQSERRSAFDPLPGKLLVTKPPIEMGNRRLPTVCRFAVCRFVERLAKDDRLLDNSNRDI